MKTKKIKVEISLPAIDPDELVIDRGGIAAAERRVAEAAAALAAARERLGDLEVELERLPAAIGSGAAPAGRLREATLDLEVAAAEIPTAEAVVATARQAVAAATAAAERELRQRVAKHVDVLAAAAEKLSPVLYLIRERHVELARLGGSLGRVRWPSCAGAVFRSQLSAAEAASGGSE